MHGNKDPTKNHNTGMQVHDLNAELDYKWIIGNLDLHAYPMWPEYRNCYSAAI
jgi:hypothetical protein